MRVAWACMATDGPTMPAAAAACPELTGTEGAAWLTSGGLRVDGGFVSLVWLCRGGECSVVVAVTPSGFIGRGGMEPCRRPEPLCLAALVVASRVGPLAVAFDCRWLGRRLLFTQSSAGWEHRGGSRGHFGHRTLVENANIHFHSFHLARDYRTRPTLNILCQVLPTSAHTEASDLTCPLNSSGSVPF